MQQRASIRFRVFFFVLTAAMITFAFVHSSMPGKESSAESGFIFGLLKSAFSRLNISFELNENIVRKLAHFSEYTAIGMLAEICAYSFDRPKPYRYLVYVLFTGLAAAVIDETIQLFSSGRAGMIADVWIDFSGVVTGAVFMLLCFMLYIQMRKRKGKE